MKSNNFNIGIIGILFLFMLFDSGYNADAKSNFGELAYFKTSKPFTHWRWFASVIKKEDIAYQLDWVKKNNFGGVEIAWVSPLKGKILPVFFEI
jgi:hypothetical protein